MHIGEDTRRSAEHLVFKCNAGVYGDIILNLAAVPYCHVRPHHYILTEHAVAADSAAAKDMTEMPDSGSSADLHVLVNNCGGMDE